MAKRRNTVWQRGEIQFDREEKYSLSERRNTVWQSGEIQIIARLVSVGGPPRMTECLVGADTRVAAGVYNSLATQLLLVIVVLITTITIVTIIIDIITITITLIIFICIKNDIQSTVIMYFGIQDFSNPSLQIS